MTETKEHDSIKERAKKKLERDMGPKLLEALHDPKTVEIMLNADGKLWLERQGEPSQCNGSPPHAQAQASGCSPSGNVVLFTNYDGGVLNIQVDEDIPDLRIGVVAYNAVRIAFTGAFASNVTEVRYAGINLSLIHI